MIQGWNLWIKDHIKKYLCSTKVLQSDRSTAINDKIMFLDHQKNSEGNDCQFFFKQKLSLKVTLTSLWLLTDIDKSSKPCEW